MSSEDFLLEGSKRKITSFFLSPSFLSLSFLPCKSPSFLCYSPRRDVGVDVAPMYVGVEHTKSIAHICEVKRKEKVCQEFVNSLHHRQSMIR